MAKITRAKLARGFVSLLADHSLPQAVKALAAEVIELRMVSQVDLLVLDIGRELFKAHGQLNAEVVSSYKLSPSILASIKALLQKETGARSVHLTQQIDPSVYGGLVARTADLEFDLSVASKLKQLEV